MTVAQTSAMEIPSAVGARVCLACPIPTDRLGVPSETRTTIVRPRSTLSLRWYPLSSIRGLPRNHRQRRQRKLQLLLQRTLRQKLQHLLQRTRRQTAARRRLQLVFLRRHPPELQLVCRRRLPPNRRPNHLRKLPPNRRPNAPLLPFVAMVFARSVNPVCLALSTARVAHCRWLRAATVSVKWATEKPLTRAHGTVVVAPMVGTPSRVARTELAD